MEIIAFSANNQEEIVVLPVTPPGITIEQPQANDTYKGLMMDLNIIGNVGLRTIEISSFFPVAQLPFMPAASVADPQIYLQFFEKWRRKKRPIRIVWTKNDRTERLNMPCTVDEFSYAVKKNGDVEYTMTLREYQFVIVNGMLVRSNV